MTLNKFEFEFEICPNRENINNIQISLEIHNDRYILYYSRDKFCTINVTDKADSFCKGLLNMDINEWDQKYFDKPGWDFFPSSLWKLSISADGIDVACKGIDNFPENWDEFKSLLYEIGITDPFFHTHLKRLSK